MARTIPETPLYIPKFDFDKWFRDPSKPIDKKSDKKATAKMWRKLKKRLEYSTHFTP